MITVFWAAYNMIQDNIRRQEEMEKMEEEREKKRDYKKAYEALNRLHKAANLANDILQQDVNKLREQNLKLMEVNTSLERQLNAQKQVNFAAITENNKAQQDNAAEIQRLRELVKKLGGDPN